MKTLTRGAKYLFKSFSVISFIAVIVLIGISPPLTHAETFGVVLDNTCLTFIKNDLKTSCPTYEDILTLFPDTSNQLYSGYFGYYNGIYQRMPSQVEDSHEFYRFLNQTNLIFIDPPSHSRDRIKMIEIKANFKEYLLPFDKTTKETITYKTFTNETRTIVKYADPTFNNEDRTLTFGQYRYINNCNYAYIDSGSWIELLGDTINHFNHNCSLNSTRYIDTFTTQLDRTEHDISTSYKWKLEQWQKEMINRCGFKVCLYAENQTQPEKHEG